MPLFSGAGPLFAQDGVASGRAAAVRHALASGFPIPREEVVVLQDAYFKLTRDPDTMVATAKQRDDAREVARLSSAASINSSSSLLENGR
jgi:hypothetical protein